MNATSEGARKRMPRRDLFAELDEGLQALAEEREGRRKLRRQEPALESASGSQPDNAV